MQQQLDVPGRKYKHKLILFPLFEPDWCDIFFEACKMCYDPEIFVSNDMEPLNEEFVSFTEDSKPTLNTALLRPMFIFEPLQVLQTNAQRMAQK
jgi:hypothetical protein